MSELDDTRFDECMRALHREALQATPTALRARLKPAAPARSFVWPGLFMTGAAALLCVGVFTRLEGGGRAVVQPQVAATVIPNEASSVTSASASSKAAVEMPGYDNDPEFYAWLASAPQLASADTPHR